MTTTTATTTTKALLVVTFISFVICGLSLNQAEEQEWKEHYEYFYPKLEDWTEMKTEKESFEKEHPEYGYNNRIEQIVLQELGRFKNQIYCDYTGSGVYQKAQIEESAKDMINNMYGNTHSENPSASLTDKAINEVRERVVKHFHTNLSKYSVIFTSGATGALKLIADVFPWTNETTFGYLHSNHNSVLGIREVALDHGAKYEVFEATDLEDENKCKERLQSLCICPSNYCKDTIDRPVLTEYPETVYNLFAYPAQDNFAGIQYPLSWGLSARRAGNWLVALDAAAYASCNDLDLSTEPADFVAVSFYKMFGYPTGLGALLVRNEIVDVMQKTFFGGGTVVTADPNEHTCVLVQHPSHRFEDGTVNFLAIRSLIYGFNALESLGKQNIQAHTHALTQYLYEKLLSLQHSNAQPLLTIFGNHAIDDGKQGSIITFIVHDETGTVIGYHKIQRESAKAHIHLRTGCMCNPGACAHALGTAKVLNIAAQYRTNCADEMESFNGVPLGAIRVSLGYLSTFEDAYAIYKFFQNYVV